MAMLRYNATRAFVRKFIIFTVVLITWMHLQVFWISTSSPFHYSSIMRRYIFRPYYRRIVYELKTQHDTSKTRHNHTFGDTKVILIFISKRTKARWGIKDGKLSISKRCLQDNCYMTYDQTRFLDADAVILLAQDMPNTEYLHQLNKDIKPNYQLWVFYTHENPYNIPCVSEMNGFINVTMTYRKDSDIYLPYGYYRSKKDLIKEDQLATKRHKPRLKEQLTNFAASKSHLVAWVVSHCKCSRDKLVRELESYLQVDVCGYCASYFKTQMKCNGQRCTKKQCRGNVRHYKFYLAFENTPCLDYVTEKYWENAIGNDVVPVVLGGGPYDNPLVAIPGSYIDASKFSSGKDLAEYLLYLDKNDTAYNEYFAWKREYTYLGEEHWSCKLCDFLHSKHERKVYDRLTNFWNYSNCMENPKC